MVVFNISKSDWRNIQRISKACSKNEKQRVLNGVYIEQIDIGVLRFVATDGYRLFYHDVKIANAEDLKSPVIVHKSLFKYKCVGFACFLEIVDGEAIVCDSLMDGGAFANTIDGEFPDYKQVVPSNTRKKRKLLSEIMFNPHLISDVVPKNGLFIFKFYGQLAPIEIWHGDKKGDNELLLGVVMPQRKRV